MNYYFQWGDPEKTFLRRSDASIGKTTDVTNNRVTFIPLVVGNRDYDEYLEWVAIDGNDVEDYEMPSLTWDNIRAKRNEILHDTDWTMTTGATVDQAQWAAYRQNIRDIPQTYKDKTPDDVVWPTQPSTKGPNS